ncbi:MAG: YebC/PmpR family DNA-binding transcriptional regulator [Candidatus Niyogibacteria bacterium CG10_big_fil_rev_8_21_14_0_10_46_36]|uniref:YebC/PmpR family DNA-binding transcriptional regulator n=1 Tax=Candidatus Niyogibacteria bacterium CG10_big_fil_rev_8_21_14_0_10_46_36 TaxID=1974726 RepID=A0A2H0TDH9_9BACT|nr:MAG: YebC/PmpR family DNA-binding transcriptional regulator [Candidatus Niyogibacteria bacterium CG10_big_fil_rev_8_21_14_0_10_46_36]
MSGHSKWSQIKHKKAATDAKKSKTYGKITRMIAVAVRQNGADPNTNPALRVAIGKAKEANMPSDNIERAIKKASGGDKEQLEELLFEAYGPGGAALLITAITDNTNRTTGEVKHILSKNGSKLAERGAAQFLFTKTDKGWESNTPLQINKDAETQLLRLFDELDEHDDVQDFYTNAEFSEE